MHATIWICVYHFEMHCFCENPLSLENKTESIRPNNQIKLSFALSSLAISDSTRKWIEYPFLAMSANAYAIA